MKLALLILLIAVMAFGLGYFLRRKASVLEHPTVVAEFEQSRRSRCMATLPQEITFDIDYGSICVATLETIAPNTENGITEPIALGEYKLAFQIDSESWKSLVYYGRSSPNSSREVPNNKPRAFFRGSLGNGQKFIAVQYYTRGVAVLSNTIRVFHDDGQGLRMSPPFTYAMDYESSAWLDIESLFRVGSWEKLDL
jgi:hypothetical protein